MALTINDGSLTLKLINNINKATSAKNQAAERISSGLKINSAKDDPAGYVMVSKWAQELSSIETYQKTLQSAKTLTSTMIEALSTVKENLEIMKTAKSNYNSASDPTLEEKVTLEEQFRQAYIAIDATSRSEKYSEIFDGRSSNVTIGMNPYSANFIYIEAEAFQVISPSSLFLTDDITVANSMSIDTALTQITEQLVNITVADSNLDKEFEHMENTSVTLQDSITAISSADIAEETANYTKYQILEEAGIAILSKMNESKSLLLRLLPT